MSIQNFNRGLDDAYMGRYRDSKGNVDYEEGLQMGEDINRKNDYEIEMKKEYEKYMKEQQKEEYYRYLKDLRED